MEVRHHGVHGAKRRRWPDEYSSLTTAGAHAAVVADRALEGADRRRSHRPDSAAAVAAGRGVRLGGELGDRVALLVHHVLRGVLHLYGLERPRADVQYHFGAIHAALGDRGEQLGGEVQSGRRCGDGAGLARVDRLVALDVGCFVHARDVRRQRDVAVCLDRLFYRATLGAQQHDSGAALRDGEDVDVEARRDLHGAAGLQLAARRDERLVPIAA